MINLHMSSIRTWLFIIPQCVYYLLAKMGESGAYAVASRGTDVRRGENS